METDVVEKDPKLIEVEFATLDISIDEWSLSDVNQMAAFLTAIENLGVFFGKTKIKEDQFLLSYAGQYYLLQIDIFYFSEIHIKNGSIKSSLTISIGIAAAIYSGVAAYPTFREGVNLLIQDVEYAMENVFTNSIQQYELLAEDDEKRRSLETKSVLHVRKRERLEQEIADKLLSSNQ